MKEQGLDPLTRATDILLGGLGIGVDATITELQADKSQFSGKATLADGEVLEFRSEDPLSELDLWAIKTLLQSLNPSRR
jgi:hypothetical protein